MSKVTCASCKLVCDSSDCLVVVIETDTGGTLVSRRIDENPDRFNNKYFSLVDSGRYPNMSNPQIECKACRGLRYKEMEEEAEYWRRKHGDYD